MNGYERHLETSVGKNLADLADKLVDEYYKGNDDGRRAELKNALTQSLKRLSKKLSEGSKVSLRLTKPPVTKVADEMNPTAVELAAIAHANSVDLIRQDTLKALAETPGLEHDPEIVQALPSPDPID